MKLLLILSFSFSLFLPLNVGKQTMQSNDENPLLRKYNTPFEVPAFNLIKEEHYMPAIKAGISEQQKEIYEIVNNKEKPSFNNTIVALDLSGSLLHRVATLFGDIVEANSTEGLQKIQKEMSPLLSKNQDDIYLNEKLFKKIKAVYDERKKLKLSKEDLQLLEKVYKEFVRGGADLKIIDKSKLRRINEELSMLGINFGNNLLKEISTYKLVIDNKEDLSGLPQSLIDAASETAKECQMGGKWVFTLQAPSIFPFLQYSDKRELREKIYTAYINKCNNNNDLDNKKIVARIAFLRSQKAKLLGFETYGAYILDNVMAKTSDKVDKLLSQIWQPALKMATLEANDIQAQIFKSKQNFQLKAWDWWYYSEKIRKEKYDLNDEELRPYFKLENVRDGAFAVANKLYGITFTERPDLPVYNPDVKAFEVKEANGKHLGILYLDYYTRPNKKGGAWMNEIRRQYKPKGTEVTPIIYNVCNFPRPTANTPSLLSFEEVTTLFHEFGHALHGLFSNVKYYSLAGTEVPRDFVELPSQIMENWAYQPEVLNMIAKHYQTGEQIPTYLIEKIVRSSKFNQGFDTVELVAAAYLDMFWHLVHFDQEPDVAKFETNVAKTITLVPEIAFRYRSTYFSHIFDNEYAAGYYSYIWAEVLDADAFESFKANGIFNKNTADSFRKNILSKGGSEEAMDMFKKFMGREPQAAALLKRKGIIK